MWYKLLKDHDGKTAGTMVKLEEGVGKALVAAAVCELVKDYDPANEERKAMVDSIAKSLEGLVKDTIVSAVKQATETISKGNKVSIYVDDHADPAAAEFGFKHWGEWLMEVKRGSAKGQTFNEQPRLKKYVGKMEDVISKLPSGFNETVGEDGGILVPPEMSTEIFRKVNAVDASLLTGRMDRRTINGNSISYPYLIENSRADGSRNGGVLGYWIGEGEQMTLSKAKWASLEFKLSKFAVLCKATEELMEDGADTLVSEITSLAADEIQYRLGLAAWNGSGVKQPRGLLNSPALVTVSRTTANRIKLEDIANLWIRIPASMRSRMVFYFNQDVEIELWKMFIAIQNVAATENVGGLPVYMPPNGLSGAPYGTILGRPAIPLEYAPALGTTGDIMACVPDQYRIITKSSGIRSAASMHLRFDYDETMWKFVFRADGQCMWPTTFTPVAGVAKSPIAVLS